jgi:hypothetical protein
LWESKGVTEKHGEKETKGDPRPREAGGRKVQKPRSVDAPTHSGMRKSKLARDVVVLDREAFRKMLDLKNNHHFT